MDSDVIERLCNLPVEYRQQRALSWTDFVTRSSIQLVGVSRDKIASFLGNRPDLVDAWLTYSEDQRMDATWCFQRSEGASLVYQYPKGTVLRFADPNTACAEFILRIVFSAD